MPIWVPISKINLIYLLLQIKQGAAFKAVFTCFLNCIENGVIDSFFPLLNLHTCKYMQVLKIQDHIWKPNTQNKMLLISGL